MTVLTFFSYWESAEEAQGCLAAMQWTRTCVQTAVTDKFVDITTLKLPQGPVQLSKVGACTAETNDGWDFVGTLSVRSAAPLSRRLSTMHMVLCG